jgi:putative pyruvate formate lyase activating enzyme
MILIPYRTLENVVQTIVDMLNDGVESLGFVSPSHMIPQMKSIIRAVHERGFYPYIVYNTNGYDSLDSLKDLEEWVDVYLPDFKYMDSDLSSSLSDAPDYPRIAGLAIREMYRQKGNMLHLNENAVAERGLIVRHLVLPGKVENSKAVLRYISDEISSRITLSLMSQYYPLPGLSNIAPLNRKLFNSEYTEVVEEMEKLGFSNGWVQEFESADFYLPDFESATPFTDKILPQE